MNSWPAWGDPVRKPVVDSWQCSHLDRLGTDGGGHGLVAAAAASGSGDTDDVAELIENRDRLRHAG
jgi:hypothetical protein